MANSYPTGATGMVVLCKKNRRKITENKNKIDLKAPQKATRTLITFVERGERGVMTHKPSLPSQLKLLNCIIQLDTVFDK